MKSEKVLCQILICGDELIELKRHGHQIPECPGLESRIQRYDGQKLLGLTLHELQWLVAVLDAVLNDPKGYPVIEYNPLSLRYVPITDPRWKICKELYDKLVSKAE